MLEAGELNDDSMDWKELWREVLAQEGPPTAEQMAQWKKDEAAIAKVEEALALPGLKFPVPVSFSNELPDFIVYLYIVRAMCLRGWERAASGDLSGGVADMLAAVDLGERFMDSETYMLPAMVGIAVEGIAIRQLDGLLSTLAKDDRSAQLEAAQAIADDAAPTQTVARAWQAECTITESMLRGLGSDPAAALAMEDLAFQPPGTAEQFPESFDAEATMQWHQAWCAAMSTSMGQAYTMRSAPEPESLWPTEAEDNPFGRQIMQELCDSPPITYLEREERHLARQGTWAVAWAARAYALDNSGALPPDADALVPDYLAALPDDPFGEGAIRLLESTAVSHGHGLEGVAGKEEPMELNHIVSIALPGSDPE
jgi:hypothetical protein